MNIALNEIGGGDWTGGITYRLNLITALQGHPDFDMKQLFLLVSDQKKANQFRIAKEQVIVVPKPKGKLQSLWYAFNRKCFNKDLAVTKIAKQHNLDAIFPFYLKAGRAKSVYWMPDFQFMHLPHLFGDAAVRGFNAKLPRYFNLSKLIVLSSEDAQKDFKTFSPEFLYKTRVMRFVARIPQEVYREDWEAIRLQYNLPERFIYLPNQFWKHKNHGVVFKALKLLSDKGLKPFVVMTGNPVDVRNPMYLASLLEEISLMGVRDQVAILGLVPHNMVYSLMRNSAFVLNPSFFEGWSTTVEECKSLGKRMILSNLAVHQEQAPAKSSYFDPNSAQELAEKIEEFWNDGKADIDLELESEARSNYQDRSRDFAERFLRIIKEAIH
jgi:glycosyltransferase involved in cell wall biosynthesis